MNKKQQIFYLILVILYILLMLWCFIEKYYITIMESICVLVGSFILGVIFAKLGDKDE